MPRDHYRLKKRVHYIEREADKVVGEVSETISDPKRKGYIWDYLRLIKSHADRVYELIEQDRQEKIEDDRIE